ncbi:hypothetical protein [Clostridium sp.]|uniref:hypothetical protein n=1 Tax=Clostridium sp. TaxID=1506 RepID=UPI003F3AEDA3
MMLDELASIILFLNETTGFNIKDSKKIINKSNILTALVNVNEDEWIQSESQLLSEFLREIGCDIKSNPDEIKRCIDIFMEGK